MPVVECNCGMVMSVASGGRRTSCIRCGIQLHVPDQAKQGNETNQGHQAVIPSSTSSSPAALNLMLPGIHILTANPVHD